MDNRLYQPNMCLKFQVNQTKNDGVIASKRGPRKVARETVRKMVGKTLWKIFPPPATEN